MGEDEREVLLHQLAQISNAGPELVDTVININPSNDDDLLLVLGALARNNDHAIQTVVVDELLRRLDTVKSSTNNTDLIILLNYALGNTGSKLAINALLSSLDHDDIDTQVSVIRGLGVHLDQQSVQNSLIILLNETVEGDILDEVIVILKDAYHDKILVSPSEDLLDIIVKTAVKLESPELYELLIQYLALVGTDDAQQHIDRLQQQHNYGQDAYTWMSDGSRMKRGWDDYNSDWDKLAPYSWRINDVKNYPNYKSYILWNRKYGVSQMNLQTIAGAFVGTYCSSFTSRMKSYAKVTVDAHVLGYTYNIASLRYTDYTSSSYISRYVYMKLWRTVYINRHSQISSGSSCYRGSQSIWDIYKSFFNYQFTFDIYGFPIRFYVEGSALTRGDVDACICPQRMFGCARFTPSLYFYADGGASSSLAVSC